jgi:hypothetical protein
MGIGWSASEKPYALERWHSAQSDVRLDQAICAAALEFFAAHRVKTVVMSPGIILRVLAERLERGEAGPGLLSISSGAA